MIKMWKITMNYDIAIGFCKRKLIKNNRRTVNNLLVDMKGEFFRLLSKSREIEIEEKY